MSSQTTKPLYVIGHRNPDTDAIAAAIGNAAFLQQTDFPEAVPARCGDYSARTAWVLQQAGLPAPELLTNVQPTAGSICRRDIVSVRGEDTFLTAYRTMMACSVRSVPVMDEFDGKKIAGIIQYVDLLKLLMPQETTGMAVRTVHSSLHNIAKTIDAENLTGMTLDKAQQDVVLMVGASSEPTIERRLFEYGESGLTNRLIMICGDRPNVQKFAIEHSVLMLLVTGSSPINTRLLEIAKRKKVIVLRVAHDTATTAKFIRCSRRISDVVSDDFIKIAQSMPLSEIKKMVARSRQELFPVVNSHDELIGVFSKSDLVDPPRTRLALVDHNEFSQAVPGIEDAEIVEILDHHRLAGDINSREPIRVLVEPVGSSSTLVARRFFHRNMPIEKNVALCLCAGILSDTINLTSPTTTERDRQVLARLCEIAKVSPDKFTAEFFSAGSLLLTGTPEAILNVDRKDFNEYGWKMSVSQIEEVGLDGFASARAKIETALKAIRETEGCDFSCLLVTDIGTHNSLLLAVGEEKILQAIEYPRVDATLFRAHGIVSRKKQLFPALARALRKASEPV